MNWPARTSVFLLCGILLVCGTMYFKFIVGEARTGIVSGEEGILLEQNELRSERVVPAARPGAIGIASADASSSRVQKAKVSLGAAQKASSSRVQKAKGGEQGAESVFEQGAAQKQNKVSSASSP